MMEARKTQTRTKSKIAVRIGSTLQNKENVPNNASKKGVEKRTAKTPVGRKTLPSKDENSRDKSVVKLKRAKTAPDFAKLHKKWETKLAKGKAVTKRAVTKIEPFHLTKEINAGPEETDFDDDYNLEVKDEEPVNILHEKSENIQEITTECCSCGKTPGKKAATPAIREFKIPTSIRKNNQLSSVKKKERKVEFEKDAFEFEPDKNALQSILNNEGIRSTPRKTKTGAYCSPSPFNQKRSSIYYTGPRPDRSPTAFEKRLSMRRAAAMMAKMRRPENSYHPFNTLIGVLEPGNRFMNAPQLNELEDSYSGNPECIPEETSEYMTDNGDTDTDASDSPHTVSEDEISWADTLKCYSQPQQEKYSPKEEEDLTQLEEEDKDALIAQLEEEVRQTLSIVTFAEYASRPEERYSVSSAIKNPEPDGSIPLQQSREKPSIYRKLFTSPSHAENRQPIIEANVLRPGYLRTANVTRNHSNMVEQIYATKPSSTHMTGSSGSTRLPVDNTLCSLQRGTGYTAERHRIPLGNCVSISPSAIDRNPECNLAQEHYLQSASKSTTSNIGVRKEISYHSTDHGLQISSNENAWVAAPAVRGNDGKGYTDNGLFTRSGLGFGSITCNNNASVTESAFVKKRGAGNLNSGVSKGTSTRSIINCPGNATGNSLLVERPTAADEGRAGYTSLVAAATASFRRKGFETRSAFHRTLPRYVQGTKPSSSTNPRHHQPSTNPCIPGNREQNILVPTPIKPVVARNDILSHESSGFISRHRQIMSDALRKSRDYAQEVLLDAEVSLYTRNIESSRKYDDCPRLPSPVAKVCNEGDEMHFVPIQLA